MGTKMTRVIIVSGLLFCVGCANPYSTFYVDHTGGADITKNPRIIIPTEQPRLIEGTNLEEDGIKMAENGYTLLGESSFNAGTVNQNLVIKQAKKVHADTVIVYSAYTDTRSGMIPMTVPNTQTSYHSGTIHSLGGGFANYSGTSTTFGSETTYMPYSFRRYDYYASFWVKMKPPVIGIYYENLTNEQRQKVESNKGVHIAAVIKNSPAFHADLLREDIIRKFNNVEVLNYTHLDKLIKENKSLEVEFEIFRHGKTIVKQFQINKSGTYP